MSRLRALLHVATPSTCNTQHQPVQRCTPVASSVHTPQQTTQQWQEFVRLLSVVGPAYGTPADQYSLIREIAQSDLAAALTCYRELAARLNTKDSK